MKRYNYTIQFLAEGNNPAEVLLSCDFNAPSMELARLLADQIGEFYVEAPYITQLFRPFEKLLKEI